MLNVEINLISTVQEIKKSLTFIVYMKRPFHFSISLSKDHPLDKYTFFKHFNK